MYGFLVSPVHLRTFSKHNCYILEPVTDIIKGIDRQYITNFISFLEYTSYIKWSVQFFGWLNLEDKHITYILHTRMMNAQTRINILTWIAYDPYFKCPDKNCLQRRRDTNFVCKGCGLDMLSHYSSIYTKAQGTLAESHAATKPKGKKK